jgi:HAD superfamily hydrolase (TIGR01490 family)
MERPFAVFDMDGTLIRWQLYHALADELASSGVIPKDLFDKVRSSRLDWKNRMSDDSFKAYEVELIKVFDIILKGLSVDTFEQAANRTFERYKEQVYTYSRQQIKLLKEKGYVLLAISGSPEVIVKKLIRFYGFDDFASTKYHSKNGVLTGEKDLTIGKKGSLLKDLVKKHNLTMNNSVAIGDSESDIEMLSLVEYPLVFNPSKMLYEHALTKCWPIILERKNVVYRLEKSNVKYELKT